MSNRPDPAQFAQYSYILAVVSAVILGLAFVLGLFDDPIKSFAGIIVWLVFLTGSIGAFMGYAAKSDFKAQTPPPELAHKARIGFRVNLGALAVTILLALLSLVITFLTR
ncbi:MAG: hypothetical protein JXB07_13295 [Anaerolineae bacterium]|nr:hypothetical protein [Anaerolineae bacterium]